MTSAPATHSGGRCSCESEAGPHAPSLPTTRRRSTSTGSGNGYIHVLRCAQTAAPPAAHSQWRLTDQDCLGVCGDACQEVLQGLLPGGRPNLPAPVLGGSAARCTVTTSRPHCRPHQLPNIPTARGHMYVSLCRSVTFYLSSCLPSVSLAQPRTGACSSASQQ